MNMVGMPWPYLQRGNIATKEKYFVFFSFYVSNTSPRVNRNKEISNLLQFLSLSHPNHDSEMVIYKDYGKYRVSHKIGFRIFDNCEYF